jgi:hypothetical protein
MTCHACRSPVDERARFCPNCGAALHRPACGTCGRDYQYGEIFCVGCGHALPVEPIAQAFLAQATSSPDDPDSERKFVTILRADLVQSTDLIAELEPEDAVLRLEPALAAMRAAVRRFGGIVSKETGDGLSVVFGAPLANDHHAPLACHAAIELVQRVAALADPKIQVRVGLHSGLVSPMWLRANFRACSSWVGRPSIWPFGWKERQRSVKSLHRKPARRYPRNTFGSKIVVSNPSRDSLTQFPPIA